MSRKHLFERLESNRRELAVATARLAAVRLEVGAQLLETVRLSAAARDALAAVTATRAQRVVDDGAPGPRSRRFPAQAEHVADGAHSDRLELHKEYAATRDPLLLAELMASYDGFARSLTGRFRRREHDDDLLQVARIGLLQAIQRFDPTLGRPFLVFARATITGELKRHIRDRTWSMRIPRSMKEDYLAVMRAVDEMTMRDGRSPSMEMLAAQCGIAVDRVVEALELRSNQWALSLDGHSGDDGEVLDITPGQDDAGFGVFEDRHVLARLLSRLPERDRRILELRFLADKTQIEIAEEIGVSQMCVSRVLARTLGRLRAWARTAVA